MTNYPASSTHKKPALSEWDRGERSFDAYPPSAFPARANREDAESQRLSQLDKLEQKVGNAAMLVYGMVAAGTVVEVFLLGNLQQWW